VEWILGLALNNMIKKKCTSFQNLHVTVLVLGLNSLTHSLTSLLFIQSVISMSATA